MFCKAIIGVAAIGYQTFICNGLAARSTYHIVKLNDSSKINSEIHFGNDPTS